MASVRAIIAFTVDETVLFYLDINEDKISFCKFMEKLHSLPWEKNCRFINVLVFEYILNMG